VLAEGSGREEIRNQFEDLIVSKVRELLNGVSLRDDPQQ
jgi:hypothetical protein